MITNRQDLPPPIHDPSIIGCPQNANNINAMGAGVVCCTTMPLQIRRPARWLKSAEQSKPADLHARLRYGSLHVRSSFPFSIFMPQMDGDHS